MYKHYLLNKVPTLQAVTDLPSQEAIQWADGLMLVYSITDRESFNYVQRARAELFADGESPALVLLGNKGDMVHLRQVGSEEGEILARDLDCTFSEVTAAEQASSFVDYPQFRYSYET